MMNKEILRLAIPNIISNISVPLLSTVDTALMGRMSELHLGAVGLGAMIFNFVYWNFGFLRMGTTGITAQSYGKKDDQEVMLTMARALVVAMVLAALVMLLQYPFGEMSFYLMNASGRQYELLQTYFYIRIWAAPATLGLYVLMGWFFGMQNAIYPLILTIFINAVNIVFSYLFIVYYGMDVEGVAYGTVIAQYVGLLLGLGLFFYKYKYLLVGLNRTIILEWNEFKRFLTINRDIFLRTFCLTFAFGFFYSQSSAGGEMILAVNVILLQFLNWMSYGIDGFAFASESLVGKYAGAKNSQKVSQSVRMSFLWAGGMATLFGLVYGVFGDELLTVFTNQEEVIIAARPYLIWMVIFPIISYPCYIWDGIFVGLTASRTMRDAMVMSLGIYLIAHFLLKPSWANHGMWLALLIFMAGRGLIQAIYYQKKGLMMR